MRPATASPTRWAYSTRERFLQTATHVVWCLLALLMVGWSAILVALLFTRFLFWVPLAYAVWYARDRGQQRRGGRRVEWLRRLPIWRHYCRYFPLELIKTADLDPGKSYIFGCHPHGIMCLSFIGHFATEGSGFSETFPGLVSHLVALDLQADFPVHRELFMAMVGRPIVVEKVAHPTPGQVSALRDAYLAALETLFDEHKVKYGFSPEQKLHFT